MPRDLLADLPAINGPRDLLDIPDAVKAAPTLDQQDLASRTSRFLQGVKDPANGLAQLMLHGAEAISPGITRGGTKYLDSDLATQEQNLQDARKATGNEGIDWMRLGGGTLSTLPVMMAMPTAAGSGLLARTGAGILSGVVGGALNPVTDGGDNFGTSKLIQAGTGAVTGVAVPAVASALSPVVSPALKKLMSSGVTPTPGEILGGPFKYLEDKATSIPLLGDAIRMGQRRAVEDLNRAAYNRALNPIGQEAGKVVGRQGVTGVEDALAQGYDKIVPDLVFQADQPFSTAMVDVAKKAGGLPAQQRQQFGKIMQDKLLSRLDSSGQLTGEGVKGAESELKGLASGYQNDPSFDNRQLGSTLNDAVAAFKDNLTRNSPADVADALAANNRGYANFKRVQNAATKSRQSEPGVFSPAQLQQAVRAGDGSLDKARFATGDALMQDLSDAGVKVLGNHYPDSGSGGRLILGMLAGGGLAFHPPAAIGAGLGMLPYTPMGQKAAAAMLTQRPLAMAAMGNLLRSNPALLSTPIINGILSGGR